jgi:hypothetical protein
MDVSNQHHAPAALSPRKQPQYPLNKRLGWPQGWSGRCDEENTITEATGLSVIVLKESKFNKCILPSPQNILFSPPPLPLVTINRLCYNTWSCQITCGCNSWSLTLREQHILNVWEQSAEGNKWIWDRIIKKTKHLISECRATSLGSFQFFKFKTTKI